MLVTGATGYIGSQIVRALRKRCGDAVGIRALVRETSDRSVLEGVSVQFVRGDLMNPVSLKDACASVDTVFHCGGLVAYTWNHRHRLYDVNVTGTGNIVNACLDAGVRRMVHTSSVAAVGVKGDGETADENAVFSDWQHGISYMESKRLAEMETRRGIAEGLDVVMVNPGVVIGKGGEAFPVSNSATETICGIYRGRIPFHPSGGLGFVDIRDVARAHLAAWEKGECGERYIIVSGNVSYRELFDMIRGLPGSAPRRAFQAGRSLGILAGAGGELFSLMTGRRSHISFEGMRLARKKLYYSNAKSIERLGMAYRPVRESIASITGCVDGRAANAPS